MAKTTVKAKEKDPTKVKAKNKSVVSTATLAKPRVVKNKVNLKKEVKSVSKKSLKSAVKKNQKVDVV